MTGIILSGGKSTRMGGKNKAFITIDGESILDKTLRIYKEIFKEIILVTNSPLEYLDYDVTIVTDLIKEKAALGGIYTGLFYASYDYAFVTACDMPFLNQDFIKHMVDKAVIHDVVVPQSSKGLQPLHAIYSQKCLQPFKRNIERNKLKITSSYRKIKVLEIPTAVVESFDLEEKMFINVNTQGDLDKILNSNTFKK